MATIARLAAGLSVAPQISEQDVDVLAACGFQSIVNNRPDGEVDDQPMSATIKAAARRCGLQYRHIPVVPGKVTGADIAAFRNALIELPGPVLAFCRTGTRSTTLWALSEAQHFHPDWLLATARSAGYDLDGVRAQLEALWNTRAVKIAVEGFFDPTTSTISYVTSDPKTGHAAIIDSVLDYDPKSGRTSTKSADVVIDYVRSRGLTIDWLLETHAHADHLSAAPYLKEKLGGSIGIGAHIRSVQSTFKKIFNPEPEFRTDGSQFDHLFEDGETFQIGSLQVCVMHVPGHTPACIAYLIGDAAFIGDTLFMPDYGTARADFPGGDARSLYRSIRKILSLPPMTRLFLCHDYQPGGREPKWETTVAEQRASNVHVHDRVTEDQFIRMRTERDKTLAMPVLILPAVQINMRAGHLPPPEDNGISYLKIPLNAL